MTASSKFPGHGWRRPHPIACALVLMIGIVTAVGAAAQDVSLVSKVDPSMIRPGTGASHNVAGRAVSADGRYVVFVSEAANVVAGQVPTPLGEFGIPGVDRTRANNVFLYDRVTGTTTLVSHVPGAPTSAANDDSYEPVISADGAFVAFESYATNLVAGTDTNNGKDVFLYERETGTVTLVSHVPGATGTAGNLFSGSPVLSADGAVVAFHSWASNLVAGTDANGTGDVFLYERGTGTVTLVSHAVGAPTTAANVGSGTPVISAGGAVVAFASTATNLVAGTDANGSADVFLYERATGTVTLVSHALGAPGTSGNGGSQSPVLSADGSFVAFLSAASDLVAATDDNADTDVFLYEKATGSVTLLSHYVGRPDVAGHRRSAGVAMSADASVVVFTSSADLFADPDVVSPGDPDDPDPEGHVEGAAGPVAYERATGALTRLPSGSSGQISANGRFVVGGMAVHDRVTGTTRRIDHVPGDPATIEAGTSYGPVLSEDGSVVVFVHQPPTTNLPMDDNRTVGPAPKTDVYLYELATSTRTLVSRHAPGVPSLTGGAGSAPAATSADGRWVAFTSWAPDIVAGQVDVNRVNDVFLHDRVTGTTTLVSHIPGNLTTTGFGFAAAPVISADGAFVAFRQHSHWRGDDGRDDVWLYERATGALTLVSHAFGAPGTPGNAGSGQPVISADGAFVAFASGASDLVEGMAENFTVNVFLYERATGAITLVSHALGAPRSAANDSSFGPAISADGTVVAFQSAATNLVAGTDLNDSLTNVPFPTDVFFYTRATGTVTLVSHVPGKPGTTGNSTSDSPVISADDRYIAFRSDATNLVAGTDVNGKSDVFLYDRVTGIVTLVSHVPGAPGVTANGASSSPLISADGSTVVFLSMATDLVPGTDTNGASDVFVYDRASAAVTLVSHVAGAPGISGNGRSHEPSISADGAVVAFESFATNLAAATDTNGERVRSDVFLHDRSTGEVTLVSHARGTPDTTGDTGSFGSAISADGTVVVFGSLATNLVDGDFNQYADVFAYVYERTGTPPPLHGPDLVETSVSNPPPALPPGGRFSVTDAVRNAGNAGATASTTRYYLSTVRRKTQESKLLGARSVPSLGAGSSSQGTAAVIVPASIRPATYYVVGCADDLGRVTEATESNNCVASESPVAVGRPDLVVTAVSDPPSLAARGSAFSVTDTVTNEGVLDAAPSATRYYLSLDTAWGSGDRRLMSSRAVPTLGAGATFPTTPAPVTVTIPTNMAAGTYFLLGCADDLRRVLEGSETNNCTASTGKVTVP